MENIKIFRIMETTYEDNTFWIEYICNDKFGYEIVSGEDIKNIKLIATDEEIDNAIKNDILKFNEEYINCMLKDPIARNKVNLLISADKHYKNLLNNDSELFNKFISKPYIEICGYELSDLIEECRQSENEMWYVEMEDLKDNCSSADEIEEYILEIKNRVNKLNLNDYIIFDEDDETVITVYGGVITQFLF